MRSKETHFHIYNNVSKNRSQAAQQWDGKKKLFTRQRSLTSSRAVQKIQKIASYEIAQKS